MWRGFQVRTRNRSGSLSSVPCGSPGFDIKGFRNSCLDGPLKEHTLIQAIARETACTMQVNNGLITMKSEIAFGA